MAKATSRNESFITLLLEVSGRARPDDLTGIPVGERAAALQEYLAANGAEMGLRMDGDTLVQGGPVAVAPAPAPVPAPAPAPAAPPANEMPAWVSEGTPPAPTADVAPAAAAAAAAAPSWGDAPAEPAWSAPEPVAADPAVASEPMSSWGAPAETPSWIAEEAAPAATAATADAASVWAASPAEPVPAAAEWSEPPAAPAPDWGSAPAAAPDWSTAPTAPSPSDVTPADFSAFPMPETSGRKMQWWWWLLTFLWPLAGVIGFLVVRSYDPKGARNLLIFGIVLIVLNIAVVASSVVLPALL